MMKTEAEHKSRRPLRWFANWCNHLAVPHLVKAFNLQDDGKEFGYRFRYHLWLYFNIDKPYTKWGTTYRVIRLDDDN